MKVTDIRSAVYDLLEESVNTVMNGNQDLDIEQSANVTIRKTPNGKNPPIQIHQNLQVFILAPVILNSVKILRLLDNNSKYRREEFLTFSQTGKKAQIIKLVQEGLSAKNIAKEVGVRTQYVYQVKKALEEAESQSGVVVKGGAYD